MRLNLVSAVCMSAVVVGRPLSAQTITGRVYDSLAKAPLVGATVQLLPSTPGAGAPIEAVSDNTGKHRLDGVPAGSYVLGFYHALLDSIGLEPPIKRISVTSGGRSPLRLDLGVPSAAGIIAAVCGPSQDKKEPNDVMLTAIRGGDTTGSVVDKTLDIATPQLIATTRSRRRIFTRASERRRRATRCHSATIVAPTHATVCVPPGAPEILKAP